MAYLTGGGINNVTLIPFWGWPCPVTVNHPNFSTCSNSRKKITKWIGCGELCRRNCYPSYLYFFLEPSRILIYNLKHFYSLLPPLQGDMREKFWCSWHEHPKPLRTGLQGILGLYCFFSLFVSNKTFSCYLLIMRSCGS